MHAHSANKSRLHPCYGEKNHCGDVSKARIRHVGAASPRYLSAHQFEGRIYWCCTKPSIHTGALIGGNDFVKISVCSRELQEHLSVLFITFLKLSFCLNLIFRACSTEWLTDYTCLTSHIIHKDLPTQAEIIEALCKFPRLQKNVRCEVKVRRLPSNM